MIGRALGRYRIVRRIGEGGMGVVYAARDTELERDVAIKILPHELAADDTRTARFEREAKAIASLGHPNICTLFDAGVHDGVRFLVLELLEGESLEDRLKRERLSLEDVLAYGSQLASALDCAHSSGIVHRDLKPGNVMLTANGAKLLDFGLAHVRSSYAEELRSASTARHSLTEEGTMLGTLPYMAPEQLHGDEADERTDIFALGTLLYEMLTGFRAFEGRSRASLIAAIVSGEPRPISSLQPLTPPHLAHVIGKCLEKDPSKRWQSAHDIATELQWIREATERSSTRPSPDGLRTRTRRLAAAGLTLLVLPISAFLAREHFAQRTGPGPVGSGSNSTLTCLTWEPGEEIEPFLSPDGNSFVYVSATPGNRDIFLRRIGGERPINLTDECDHDDYSPVFSPDGQLIAFRSERDGGGIFLMGATGENVRRLTDFGHDPAWSPDAKSIAVAAEYSAAPWMSGTGGLWLVDVLTGRKHLLMDGSARHPSWSPSGARIAFHGISAEGGPRTLATIPVSGGAPTFVTSACCSAYPEWTPSGILFTKETGEARNLWAVTVDERDGSTTGDEAPLVLATNTSFHASTSRDESRLLFSSRSGMHTVLEHPFDPGLGRLSDQNHVILRSPRRLVGAAMPSPDGRWLATLLFENGRTDLLLIERSTTETRRLTAGVTSTSPAGRLTDHCSTSSHSPSRRRARSGAFAPTAAGSSESSRFPGRTSSTDVRPPTERGSTSRSE